ncbi:prepilin peptidase [Brevibacillus massiliensis]|jgi:leader peptidase (prepilin peptidase)/N-methyltransferase|uniref:prepilin peptidase n=1 Tax=Brevibacillus massiliensis TaxID=1118054 RepID=UPI00030271D8|nr:A24 family peptidase [Brevibacillus massiliensis]
MPAFSFLLGFFLLGLLAGASCFCLGMRSGGDGEKKHARAGVFFMMLTALAAGGVFAWTGVVYGTGRESLMGALFAAMLATVSVTDVRFRLIPNRVIVPFGAAFFLLRCLFPADRTVGPHLMAMAASFALLLLLARLPAGGIGGGDVKLYAVVALFLGMPKFACAALLSAGLGCLYGLSLCAIKGRGKRVEVPMAPFIAAGSLAVYLGGPSLAARLPHFLSSLLA